MLNNLINWKDVKRKYLQKVYLKSETVSLIINLSTDK